MKYLFSRTTSQMRTIPMAGGPGLVLVDWVAGAVMGGALVVWLVLTMMSANSSGLTSRPLVLIAN